MGRPQVISIRPVVPADAQAFSAFVRGLSPASRYNRFLLGLRELAPGLLRLLTQAPGEDRLGLVALEGSAIVGEARYAAAGARTGEFAIAVADAWQRRGLGRRLLDALLLRARSAGLERVSGEVAAANAAMLAFMRKAGFRVRMHPRDARLVLVDIELDP